jgi:Ca2+-binding RTX toxin-like protein
MAAFKLNLADLVFVLKQIKIAEAHASGTPLTEIWVDADGNVVPANTPGATLAVPSPMAPFGLRTVDGTYNNIVPGRETWGAADQTMPRLLPTYFRNENDDADIDINGPAPGGVVSNENYAGSGNVVDSDPRTISNLIADQSFNNPAAIVAALSYSEFYGEWAGGDIYGVGGALEVIQGAFAVYQDAMAAANGDDVAEAAALAAFDLVLEPFAITHNGLTIDVPNIAPDEGLSVPFNAWMTFFGQFFDHGLDLINKGGAGTVFVPLAADDPLRTHGPDGIAGNGDEVPPSQAFMVLTRATPPAEGGQESVNQTTPFVDQNQTYTSHASHQVFLREYDNSGPGGQTANTGHLLDGADGNSLPTWAEVKAQALSMLGIELTDRDVINVPLLRTDAYGNFIPDPITGYAQVIVGVGEDGIPNTDDDLVESGTPGSPVNPTTVGALRTGHGFLDDIAHNAAPVSSQTGLFLTADADGDVNGPAPRPAGTYDNELLDRHFITGDGRGNENIGLTTVHHIFHSEHNRQVEQQKLTILQSGDADFVNEWLDLNITQDQLNAMLADAANDPQPLVTLTAYADTLNWDGDRLFQGARMATEMQYQHLVFEEFARKIQPNIDPFVFNSNPDINPAIFAEFAHVVYRFGHSMLTDNMPRVGPDGELLDPEDVGLIAAFLNPVMFDNDHTITADEAAGAIIRGMTIERGNEIDEFVVNALRNNLLGLPLDLPAINIARGRDTGMPSLNQARQALFDASGSTFLEPYDNWVDFAGNLKNPVSVVNFIAAYGTHLSITSATTMEAKRDAAMLLVFGGDGAPADRVEFLTATGAYTDKGGLNEVDLWIGGLAEKKMPFGGMLGSTFNAVFELQLENLQDGDRFYYLTRTQGQNFLVSLEQNSFMKMIMANTDLAQPGPDGIRGTADDIVDRHMGVDSFGVYDFVLEVNAANQADYNGADPGVDPTGNNPVLEAMGLGKVIRDNLSTPGADANYIRVQGGEHVVVGGTSGDDTIITDFGDDGIWGDDGNDRIESGAGVDLVNGGGGNDIITDSGDTGDFLKGDEGDDVISGGNGLDIIMGGEGNDVVFHGVDDTETFAGQGNDFVLGGDAVDLIMGNEGDDWLEAGKGFDTTAGDNSELFFDSRIIGHDVMFSGEDEHDFDAESGDDIMVQGESVLRSEGMFGFDWATYKGNTQSADADLGRPIFTTEVEDVLRNRFDKVEAVSGWDQNDLLVGDNRELSADLLGVVNATAEGVFFRDEINAEGIARIDNLDDIITANEMFAGVYGSDFSDNIQQIFSGGNVLIGGGGSDVIMGKAGNDIIDGDRWLNVRIRITDPGDTNTAANQIATIDSLKHVFTAETAGANTAWIGKSLVQLITDRVIVPSQLHIVREIVDDGGVGDTDVAVFWDVLANYTFTAGDNGEIVVSHTGFGNTAISQVALDAGFINISDGVDTLRNVERIRVMNAAGTAFTEVNLSTLVSNRAATGNAVINDATPTEGQTLSVATGSIQDQDGLNPFSRQWQSSTDGINWTNIAGATGTTFTLPTLPGQGIIALAGQMLRVVVNFTDDRGFAEQILGTPTQRIGITWTAQASATGVTFTAPGGNDTVTGSGFVDTLNGGAGNDTISGGNGNDTLNGGDGNDQLMGGNDNDTMAGGAGNDTLNGQGGLADVAVFTGPVASYRYTTTGDNPVVTDTVGAGGSDTMNNTELLRIAGTDYTVRMGTNGVENFAGQAGNQIVFGRQGNDVLNGGDGNDIIVGGAGNDTMDGGTGNDHFVYHAGADGRDFITGGAADSNTDTFVLHGAANTAETFRVYTREAFLAANPLLNPAALNADTEIVITRNGTNNASVIAELDNIEEIIINSTNTSANDGGGLNQGNANGDTVEVFGDFTQTDLDFSTITINGSSANDTVDITGLSSDHRVVFNSNGGLDTVLGDVRTQDVFNGITNDQRVETASSDSSFGAFDGLAALFRSEAREMLFGNTEGFIRGLQVRTDAFGLNDLNLELGLVEQSFGRTMVENTLDNLPLDLFEPIHSVVNAPMAVDLTGFDRRSILSDYDYLVA